MSNPKPTEQDRANYSRSIKESDFFACPELFLTMGQKVRAKFRVWDLPNDKSDDWGWVSAEPGEEGEVVHVQDGYWPTVRFASGKATCVTDFEVEPL